MLNKIRIGPRLFWQALGMAFWLVVLALVALNYLRDLNRTTAAIYTEKLEPGASGCAGGPTRCQKRVSRTRSRARMARRWSP